MFTVQKCTHSPGSKTSLLFGQNWRVLFLFGCLQPVLDTEKHLASLQRKWFLCSRHSRSMTKNILRRWSDERKQILLTSDIFCRPVFPDMALRRNPSTKFHRRLVAQSLCILVCLLENTRNNLWQLGNPCKRLLRSHQLEPSKQEKSTALRWGCDKSIRSTSGSVAIGWLGVSGVGAVAINIRRFCVTFVFPFLWNNNYSPESRHMWHNPSIISLGIPEIVQPHDRWATKKKRRDCFTFIWEQSRVVKAANVVLTETSTNAQPMSLFIHIDLTFFCKMEVLWLLFPNNGRSLWSIVQRWGNSREEKLRIFFSRAIWCEIGGTYFWSKAHQNSRIYLLSNQCKHRLARKFRVYWLDHKRSSKFILWKTNPWFGRRNWGSIYFSQQKLLAAAINKRLPRPTNRRKHRVQLEAERSRTPPTHSSQVGRSLSFSFRRVQLWSRCCERHCSLRLLVSCAGWYHQTIGFTEIWKLVCHVLWQKDSKRARGIVFSRGEENWTQVCIGWQKDSCYFSTIATVTCFFP